ncbi:hypothetical protein [Rhizobium sp. Root483D2]|uniref:hypothetical protein n=1 Tax=Rhizobium sp. Root483D2 TaxID=1736545 RepID=UPI0012E3356F|nr:hypothetical protein [Rhizobium sp. Root483D2]
MIFLTIIGGKPIDSLENTKIEGCGTVETVRHIEIVQLGAPTLTAIVEIRAAAS